MMPIKLLRRSLGQPSSATQGLIDYWRDQYRDYSKTTNALWDRLRPGFTQVPAGTVAPPPAASVVAVARAKTIGQLDAELEALKRAMAQSFDDYILDEKAREADRASGWPGSPDWRKAQLEEEFFDTKAKLWAELMERTIAFLKKLEDVMRAKEARIRAEIAAEVARVEAARRAAAGGSAGGQVSIPVLWEDLCLLSKNYDGAEQERASMVARGAPPAAIQTAEAEASRALKELTDRLRGAFSSIAAMLEWMNWCEQIRGVPPTWRSRVSPASLLSEPVVSTPPATAPTLPSYYGP